VLRALAFHHAVFPRNAAADTVCTVTEPDRRYFDADSHVLEPQHWLSEYVDPTVRDRLRPLAMPIAPDADRAGEMVATRTAVALDGDRNWGRGYSAFGAWDPDERVAVLDKYRIDCQFVFSTFAPSQFLGSEPEVLWAGVRAHTRALAAFCSHDPRLLPVPLIPFSDVDHAVAELEFALAEGCGGVLVQSTAPSKSMGPSDPFWARLQDADVPFITHIGTGGRLVPTGYRENGREVPTDFLGGGENVRSKDFLNIGYWPENFLSVLALDGVFERFPRLRGASIEQGAAWLPGMLKKLDGAMQFARTEPDLAALPLPASDYIRRQVKFAPFPKDDVGWILDNVGADMLMFSTDFPHPEGTRDPLGRFATQLDSYDDTTQEKFYIENMRTLLGSHAPA
jgi:predicted TIM-barrel fold metal-dependent hydrolase